MAGFEQHKQELDELGVKVVAASIDPVDKAKLVADEVSFPVGYGVTRAMADRLGSWWEERRSIIQPSEFLVAADGKVLAFAATRSGISHVDSESQLSFASHHGVRFLESVECPGFKADLKKAKTVLLDSIESTSVTLSH